MSSHKNDERKKRQFIVPEFPYIFDLEKSPFDNLPIIDKWVEDVYEMFKNDVSKEQFAKRNWDTVWFVHYCYSGCKQLDKYENLVKINLLFFTIDDTIELSDHSVAKNATLVEEVVKQLLRGLVLIETNESSNEINEWKPYTKGAYLILKDICSSYNETQSKRCIKLFREYFEENINEYKRILSGFKFKVIEDFIAIKRIVSGATWVVQLLEYGFNTAPTEDEWKDPVMKQMFNLCCDYCCNTNDIYSFEKEYIDNKQNLNAMTNVVAFRALRDDNKIEKALKDTIEDCIQKQQKFRQLSVELHSKYPALKDYVRSMELLMSGNIKFSQRSKRYNYFAN